jgi:hypothetical protein
MTHAQITVDHLNAALKSVAMHADGKYSVVDVFNKAQELAEANAQQETYITADQAQKRGAGNAEYRSNKFWVWQTCGENFMYWSTLQYRAIKQAQPEPVDPHAALRAEYGKQVMLGTVKFYKWECKFDNYYDWSEVSVGAGFSSNKQYRCTDISCYVSKDGDPAIRMLRKDVQELQAKLGNAVEWETPTGYHSRCNFEFDQIRTYTYRTKATIKLDGNMVTPEQAAAEWESKQETCDLWFKSTDCSWVKLSNLIPIVTVSSEGEYELRAKPAKEVKWADVPAGVALKQKDDTLLYLYHGFNSSYKPQLSNLGAEACNIFSTPFEELELAPAADQPWIARQDSYKGQVLGLVYEWRDNKSYKITGLAEGFKMEGSV